MNRQKRPERGRHNALRDFTLREPTEEVQELGVFVGMQRVVPASHLMLRVGVVQDERDVSLRIHRLEDINVRNVHHNGTFDVQRPLDEFGCALVDLIHGTAGEETVRAFLSRRRFGICLETLAGKLFHRQLDSVPYSKLDLLMESSGRHPHGIMEEVTLSRQSSISRMTMAANSLRVCRCRGLKSERGLSSMMHSLHKTFNSKQNRDRPRFASTRSLHSDVEAIGSAQIRTRIESDIRWTDNVGL